MSGPTTSFYRVEEYWMEGAEKTYGLDIICSFETRQHGYFKIGCRTTHEQLKSGPGPEIEELDEEPSLHLLPESDQRYIERVTLIIWRMVFDTPAATDRFK